MDNLYHFGQFDALFLQFDVLSLLLMLILWVLSNFYANLTGTLCV